MTSLTKPHRVSRYLKLGFSYIVIILVGSWALSWLLMPSPQEVMRLAMGSDRVLLSQDGQLLQTIRTDYKKRRLAWYHLDQFSKAVQDSVVEAEDLRFRYHPGIDPIGLGRAILSDLRGRPVQGASTISMQLADLIQKDTLLRNRPIKKGSWLHKLGQVGRALLLERRWSKDEILEAYLNLIHLKGEFQGVPALSYAYLNKHPLALDQDESSVIAAMISSPNQTRASLQGRACFYRRHQVSQVGGPNTTPAVFTETDCARTDAVAASFFQTTPKMPAGPGFAPHLAQRLFKEHPKETTITSTIDLGLQRKVLSIIEKNLQRLKNQNVHDSAAIVIENKTGRVLAYVGTVPTSESPFVDGVTSYRQAGSSLKPFIYGKAIDTKTLTAASILMDDATAISWNGDVYRPANYDQHFQGAVSVREALASSLNVPAIKTVTILGLKPTYQLLQSMKLSNLRGPEFYGVSMALGAVEVRLDELANDYRMLANGGLWTPLQLTADHETHSSFEGAAHESGSRSKVADATDATSKMSGERILSPGAAYIVSSILSDPNARSIGFGWDNPLETPFWTAVKTGTSKDYRDNWCMGFSELYTVGVWAGNFDAQAMEKVSGVSGVGPTWFEIMNELHAQKKSLQPVMPNEVETKKIRHQWASREINEFFLKGTAPPQEVIEPANTKRVQFVFPAEGSILVKDPHQDQDQIALYVRFKGQIPEGSVLKLNGKVLGPALSPFKIEHPPGGEHDLAIVAPDRSVLSKIHFTIHGPT